MHRVTGKFLSIVTLMCLTLGAPTAAHAGPTIRNVLNNISSSSEELPYLLAALSYMFGVTLAVFAIVKFYEHVQNPHQTSIWEGMKRTMAASCFLALPIVVEAAYVTMNDGTLNAVALSQFSGATAGSGLDAMMQQLMDDMHDPLLWVMNGFCYLAGITLVLVGISRLLKSSQEGPRGPGGIGTLMTFIVAGALLSVDAMMGAWSSSLFGSNVVQNTAGLSYTGGMTAAEVDHVHGVISSILIFMMILGWVSFIRGWFIIRDVAEGNHNASLMAGITHLFGGALAVNLGPLMNVVQETLGLSGYGVSFT
ncbi:MAG: hypothetical protein HYS17_01275 [Micavibrio aeruginosavorus]|uniref:Type IV secretion protein IcmC n=1 Tax=Micavibrio aeruginosavorus TaxID=349221 RepID=A0A7T5R2S2_9BACT|nr:MAG: hypothetical protein HYS17_01275 [Micavibrio aeruginosavorus]